MKKVPFYFALATCILAITSLYFFTSAIVTGIFNNTTINTIEFLKSEISFRNFLLDENSYQHKRDYVKQHFEKNLTATQLKKVASNHWTYCIKVNGETANANGILVTSDLLKLEIIQTQIASLLDDEFHNLGSITGGDNTDSIVSHIKIESNHKYTLSNSTEIHQDEETGEQTQITRYTYEFEVKEPESKDESISVPDPVKISYSPIFLNIGLCEGQFPEKIIFAPQE